MEDSNPMVLYLGGYTESATLRNGGFGNGFIIRQEIYPSYSYLPLGLDTIDNKITHFRVFTEQFYFEIYSITVGEVGGLKRVFGLAQNSYLSIMTEELEELN